MKFIRDLHANNNRDWFLANKSRYETVMQEPALEFIEAFAPSLHAISPNFVASARKSGGSLFRINRDVRFAKDKSPYKTHLGIQFRHKNGKDVHAPGYYLHIEPRASFVGVGTWHPEPKTLDRIRQSIVEDSSSWKRAAYAKKFKDAFELEGDSLQRAPKGYDPGHPFVEDLKRKDFIAAAKLPDSAVTSETLLRDFTKLCRSADGFMKFLCDAAGVEF
jgi:uncharacterized protein (TIGR02453 family)